MNKKTVKELFEEKIEMVSECGCWIWMAAISNKKGYGAFWISGKTDFAHRASWRIFRGIIPSKMFVLHHCDTPACVNPHHLFLGTNKDNMMDCKKKGRDENCAYFHPFIGEKSWFKKGNDGGVFYKKRISNFKSKHLKDSAQPGSTAHRTGSATRQAEVF
jgi:hypothetical protein